MTPIDDVSQSIGHLVVLGLFSMVGTKKHERKVLECYPRGTGEEGVSGGKLSALTYYINAKPAKLLKVSAFLERKVSKDLTRESPQ